MAAMSPASARAFPRIGNRTKQSAAVDTGNVRCGANLERLATLPDAGIDLIYRDPPFSKQVISKQRVADHGEVLTGKREVNAMLDLVKSETERIDSRFLEPGCGTGNFLAEILERKLRVVETRYGKTQLDYERHAILAVSSVYGIDILEDNVRQCRQRLFGIFDLNYRRLFRAKSLDDRRESVRYILKQNIIYGDALSLTTVGNNPKPIVFAEWSPVNGSLLKRRDFTLHELLAQEAIRKTPVCSDRGKDAFIPTPQKEYPPTVVIRAIDVVGR